MEPQRGVTHENSDLSGCAAARQLSHRVVSAAGCGGGERPAGGCGAYGGRLGTGGAVIADFAGSGAAVPCSAAVQGGNGSAGGAGDIRLARAAPLCDGGVLVHRLSSGSGWTGDIGGAAKQYRTGADQQSGGVSAHFAGTAAGAVRHLLSGRGIAHPGGQPSLQN